jgi:hypothetical protein
MLRHRGAQVGQVLREADQAVVLLLFLLRPERRVVEVLAAAGRVDARRLQLGVRSGRDPHVFPRRGNDERLDARELRLVADAVSARVVVPKAAV